MPPSSKDYDEKRNFIRMKIDTIASILIDGTGEQMQGICRDLSGGGMLIEVAKPIALGQEVEIIITSSHGHSPMLQAKACVNRCSPEGEKQYLVGLEVVKMLN